MAAATAASLLLPSSVPKNIPISARPTALALTFSSSKTAVIALPKLFMSIRREPARAIIPRVVLQSEFDQEEEEEEASDFSLNQKLFVGNLPFNVDSAELAGLFERVGSVEMVEVIYDKMTGKSRGFGFVTMSTAEEVEAAVEQFNGYELQGRPLRVNCGPPPPKDEFPSRGSRSGGGFDSPNRVYVGNLPWSVDNLALETLFSEQGKVTEAKVVYDRDSGRSRGFGFVTYSSAAEVNNAISSLDGFDVDGRSIRVSVAEARPRQ